MALEKLKISKKTENKKDKFVPFEKEYVIHPLKMFISIVPFGQATSIVKMLEECGVTCSVITSAEGTGYRYLPNLLSAADSKKQIIMSFVREDKSEIVCKTLKQRFNTSKAARGISLSVKLTSVAGVSIYKFLTNTRKVTRVRRNGKH